MTASHAPVGRTESAPASMALNALHGKETIKPLRGAVPLHHEALETLFQPGDVEVNQVALLHAR